MVIQRGSVKSKQIVVLNKFSRFGYSMPRLVYALGKYKSEMIYVASVSVHLKLKAWLTMHNTNKMASSFP